MHSLQIRQEGEGGPDRDSERQNLCFTLAAGEECGFRWCQSLLGSLGWEHSSGVMGRSAEPGVMGKTTEPGLAWPLRFSATLCPLYVFFMCVPDALRLVAAPAQIASPRSLLHVGSSWAQPATL